MQQLKFNHSLFFYIKSLRNNQSYITYMRMALAMEEISRPRKIIFDVNIGQCAIVATIFAMIKTLRLII